MANDKNAVDNNKTKSNNKNQIKLRLLIILLTLSIFILVLIGRVAWLQMIQGDELKKAAFQQKNLDRVIEPNRGIIYDRNGKELAISASVETVYANPEELKDYEEADSEITLEDIADKLSSILGLNSKEVLKKLQNHDDNKLVTYRVIAKKIEKDIADKVRKYIKDITGIYLIKDSKRYYPGKNLAAQVLGFTGTDSQGLAGIEYEMDKYLRGVPGKILGEVDVRGRELPKKESNTISAQDGNNVILTIDDTIQYFAERALQKAIDDYKVLNGGCAIVMDPRSGEILAMVSKPDFDLNSPFSVDQSLWRNKTVDNTYEPGSTFKAIIAAAGLEEGVVNTETPVVCKTVKVGGWPMSCWKDGGHGAETFKEGVYNSCNPVFIKLAELMGPDRFYKYIKAFGFNEKTGIELPGEMGSIMHLNPTVTDMATASYGQSFQVTPIQIITAYAALANGGKLLKPHIIKELTDSNGNIIEKYDTEIVRTVLSKQTSDTMKQVLEGVVSLGTGINAYVEGYKVAGKTATSQTFDENGQRSKEHFIASFSAFAPADNPVVCALVVLDYPSIYSHAGGVVAGPVAGEIVDEALNYLGVEKRYSEQDKKLLTKEIYVPDVTNKKVAEAKKILMQAGLSAKVIGDGNSDDLVHIQIPEKERGLPYNSIVILNTTTDETIRTVKMPDLVNKTVDEAVKTMNSIGLNIKVSGFGTAIIQEIPAGEEVPLGRLVKVQFRIMDSND